jgi:DNA-binding NarL/FixJ family response regulator
MATAGLIRVLIADDHAMVRQGLRSALAAYPNIQVVGEAEDGDEAVMRAAQLQPEVVVMDINMLKMDGITATRLIKTQHPQIVVIGLSVYPKEHQVDAMQKAGAFEVLSKDKAVTELYGAIQRGIASIQPILILKDTSSLEESALPDPQDVPAQEVIKKESGSG